MTPYHEKFTSENTMVHFFFFLFFTINIRSIQLLQLQHGQGKSNYIDDISRYIHTCTYECP